MKKKEEDEYIISLRLPAELAEEVGLVAQLDNASRSQVIRDSIVEHIAARRADPEFQRRLRERITADQALLARIEAGRR